METVSTAQSSSESPIMEPRARRKRQLTRDLPPKIYRRQFSCEHVGRYVPSTKRRIKWTFGITNLHAAIDGKSGIDCRGEEHEVELVWSLQSEKIRLFWDKKNIPFHVRDKLEARKIELNWESRSGERYQIVAHESSSIRLSRQYDFFVNDSSIFSFPRLSELAPLHQSARYDDRPTNVVVVDQTETYDELSGSSEESASMSERYRDYNNETRQGSDARLRLSMAGFVPCVPLEETGDDLISLYSLTNNALDSLRQAVTCLIPNSEDMVSRSIINALSEDDKKTDDVSVCSELSCLSIDTAPQIPTEIVANILCETTEWAKSNALSAPRQDVREQKRLFLQNQMFAIFKHAHNERLAVDDVLRALLDIATLLNIPVRLSTDRERDTLIIRDLEKKIEQDTLIANLSQFEALRQIGVSSNRSFAFCRFASERGPLRAFAAADKGTLFINGKPPHLTLLQKPLLSGLSGKPGVLTRRAISNHEFKVQDERQLPKPVLSRRRSHQRNTFSIDTLIVESPVFRRWVHEASPRDIASFDSLEKIFDSKDFSSRSVPGMEGQTDRMRLCFS